MMAFLDLFSGIGGFALGAYLAGLRFNNHYFSEIDEYAVQVYQKRFPEAENLGDIRNVDYGKLPRGEWLVTGGFPCQPHSDAGKKKGADDERDLWPECRRMLRDLRPRIALFENVRGLFTSPGRERKGEFFNGVLSDIHDCGYDAEWQVISAADVEAPHLRKRVWIVAYSQSGESRKQAEWEGREGFRRGSEEKPMAYAAKQGLPKRAGGEGGEGRQTKKPQRLCETLADSQKQYGAVERRETPVAGRSGETLAYAESGAMRDDGSDVRQADRKIDAFADAGIPCGEKPLADADDAAPARQREHGGEIYAGAETIRLSSGGTSMADSEDEGNVRRDGELGAVEQALRRRGNNGGGKTGDEFMAGQWWAVEPSICSVVDGLPAGLGGYEGRVCAKSFERVNQLKCLGNAVVPQCAEMILRLPVFDRWRKAGKEKPFYRERPC